MVPMSVIKRLAADGDIGNALLLYVFRRGGECWASRKTIAGDLGISTEAVRKGIARQCARRYLAVIGERNGHQVITADPEQIPGTGEPAGGTGVPGARQSAACDPALECRKSGTGVPGAIVRTAAAEETLQETREETPEEREETQTGADAPERPDMPSLPDQWRDLQAEAEDLWSDTTDERPTVPPKATPDALTALLADSPDELHAAPSAEKPDVTTDATTPSDRGGDHAGEPHPTPATPPPHSAPPPPAPAQQEPAQATRSLFGPVTPEPTIRAAPAPAPFVLEPPAAKAPKGGKRECPPAALAKVREAWLQHVGGRKGAMPQGFAGEVADLLALCSGDVDLVCHAIKGFARSDFHMGRDEKSGGKSWKSPRYVGRHLDDFLGMADEAEKAPNGVAAEAFRAAELQVKKLDNDLSAQIVRELMALPAATSHYAATRFQATPLDREGVVRGVKVAWRAWNDHDGVHAKRITCLTMRVCTLAVLAKEAAAKWGAGSMQVHVLKRQMRQRVPTLDCLAEMNAWDIEARAAAIAALDALPAADENACAPELDHDTQAAQPLAAKELAHV